MPKRQWGVLGTGSMAAKFCRALRRSPAGRVVAVGSRTCATAEEFCAAHGIPVGYGRYAELLHDPDVHLVYIALPNNQHFPWALRALRAGKSVLCEKPLTADPSEAAELTAAARLHGVRLLECYLYRSHPQTRALYDLVRSAAIGRLRRIEARLAYTLQRRDGNIRLAPELDGGCILDIGCYLTSMALLLAEAAAESSRDEQQPAVREAWARIGVTGVEEEAGVILDLGDDLSAELSCDFEGPPTARLELTGSRGSIRVTNAWRPECGSEIHWRADGSAWTVVDFSSPAPRAPLELMAEAMLSGEHEAPVLPMVPARQLLCNAALLGGWRRAAGVAAAVGDRS